METDELTLEMDGEVPSAATTVGSLKVDTNQRHLGAGQRQVIVGTHVTPVRPHAPRLIAEDPEKRRIVGRPARPVRREASPLTVHVSGERPQEPVPELPPAPPVFEGTGLAEVGSLRKPKQADDEDDEFSYALEGGKREEGFHKQVFRPKAMPAHLVSNVKQRLNTEVLEEEEEEEEEEERQQEDEGEEEGDADEATDGDQGEEDKQQHSRSRDKQLSWTSFAVSEVHMESLPDVSDPAKPALESPVQTSLQGRITTSNEDLPSYKLMQALQVTVASAAAGHSGVTMDPSSPGTMASCGNGRIADTRDVGSPTPLAEPLEAPGAEGWKLVFGGNMSATGAAAAATEEEAAAVAAASAAAAAVAQKKTVAAPAAAATAPSGMPVGGSRVRQNGAAGADVAVAAPDDEWELANRERQQEQQAGKSPVSASGSGGATATAGTAAVSLTYHKALLQFMAMDLSSERSKVVATLPPPRGFVSRLLCLGPPDLKPPLLNDQHLQLLSLARLPFSNDSMMHVQLLGALYRAFTGKTYDPPRYGSHWAELGFQGQDPATDLRGCGMLGLLQLYYLTQWSAEGARKMLRLSQHPVQEFPLAIVSLNVTKWTLQALRSGHLHKAANSLGSMVEAAQQFHAGCMVTFYTTWLTGSKTMTQSGHVLRDLEALALRKTAVMLAAAKEDNLPVPPPAAASASTLGPKGY